MKTIGMVGKIGHKLVVIRKMNTILHEQKKVFSKDRSRVIANGVVGIAVLVGVIAVVTPIVKAQLQQGDVASVELVAIQEETVDFVKFNSMVVNYSNDTLSELYSFIQSGFSAEQREVLLTKKYELLEYKTQLSPSNPMHLDLSTNTIQKITILLTAIDSLIDKNNIIEEDMVKLNLYTNEYKKTSEKERELLYFLLNYAGMQYEVLDSGQVKYSYLTLTE